ncbi:hypothetical protein [Clostridium butyricum]|uniref:hypothetical protein n=1 Tax=Clostridium butyricum TaxID=1492 RepID=UPI002ABDE63A|nr:hypothetical protein [Clostridium butyricum]
MISENQKEPIKQYIEKCSVVLEKRDINEAEKLSNSIISIFKYIIPDIESGLNKGTVDAKFRRVGIDYLFNISLLKEKLEFLIQTEGRFMISNLTDNSIKIDNGISNSGNSTNTNTNTNTNTVNATFDIKAELDKARQSIEDDEVLGDEDKEEINAKLDEIETVMAEDPSNNEKWKKLKSVVNWVTTKGYKIGQLVMPLITKALFPEAE